MAARMPLSRSIGAVLAVIWLLTACTTPPATKIVSPVAADPKPGPVTVAPDAANNMTQQAREFFAVYARRQDQDALMAFYAENAELRDMVYGNRVSGKQAIATFYSWDDGSVSLLQPRALEIESLIADGLQVVARGYFTPFIYHQQRLGPWYFVIWLEFNPDGKIIRQTDWINYTPKEQFIDGENLNSLIRP